MEVLPFVRMLWRRRLALAAGAVVAIALALVIGSPPAGSSAVAWTRVALDTPSSQLVESAPYGANTLQWRASLMTHLMRTDATRRQLAQQLRVSADDVAVVDPVLAEPVIAASVPEKAAAAAVPVAPYVVTVSLQNVLLPVISIEAVAPDAAAAKRLAAAAAGILEAQSSIADAPYSSLIKTGGGAAAKRQRFLVEQVAPIRARPVRAKVVPIKQIGAPLFLFGLWVAAVLILPGRTRRRRPRRVAPAV